MAIGFSERFLSGRTHIALLCALLFGLLLPTTASAQSVLDIVDINTKEAPSLSVYFSARNADGSPISGLKAEDITLEIDGSEPPLDSKELQSFKKGESPVAAVVVFPIAADYIEQFFGIRSNVANFLGQFRQIDFIGYVAYGANASPSALVTGADIPGMAQTIRDLENTDEIEPNLFGALIPAIAMLKNAENVKQKYLVVVSNAEGAVVGDDKAAASKIAKFQQTVKELGIRPLIVGYTPDGPDALTYRKWLKQMSLAGGTYTEATAKADLPGAMNKVYEQIFQQYILNADIAMEDPDEYWLEEGKYPFTVIAKVGSQELKSTQKAAWPAVEKPASLWWWWFIVLPLLILLGAFLLIFIIIKIVKRKKKEPEEAPQEMMVAPQPQEFHCESCGKVIPEELYNFRGEFCMAGGQADCPYYQMPDHGRLTVNKGTLADITFFIKDEVTTIGRLEDSSVYLKDQTVSKKHAAIKVDEGNRYEIRDFGSTSGTFVNGEKIQRMFLRDGDEISFGQVEVTFHLK